MLTHRHLGLRHLVAAAILGGLVAAAPATAQRYHRYYDRGHHDVARLAHGLEAATDQVRRQIHGRFFWDRRGGDARLERDLVELQRQAARFRHEVERRSPASHHARRQLDVLLQRFYDADRTIRRTAVPGHARNEFERARHFMDTLIDRYGGYRHFRHVNPSHMGGGRHDGRGHHDGRGRSARPRRH